MILHTCPKCHTPCLYALELGAAVNCLSCGSAFTLTRFTKTEKDAFARFIESAQSKTQAARTSRRLLYAGVAVASTLIIWLGISAFGFIPDEWRVVNRRFASVTKESHLKSAVGLVAIGRGTGTDGDVFQKYLTAVAITNDGFMLTSKHITVSDLFLDAWVFVDGKRLDARIVGADKIADFALLKVDGTFARKFPLAQGSGATQLNVGVHAIGFEPLEKSIRSPGEWPLAVTNGTISRTYADDLGTRWIEHSAVLGERSRGGPLILNDVLIGLNIDSKSGITRAVALAPYYEAISRMIDEWETGRVRTASGGTKSEVF